MVGWLVQQQQLRRPGPVQRTGQRHLQPLAAAELAGRQVGTGLVQVQQRKPQALRVGLAIGIGSVQVLRGRTRRVQLRQALVQIGHWHVDRALPG